MYAIWHAANTAIKRVARTITFFYSDKTSEKIVAPSPEMVVVTVLLFLIKLFVYGVLVMSLLATSTMLLVLTHAAMS